MESKLYRFITILFAISFLHLSGCIQNQRENAVMALPDSQDRGVLGLGILRKIAGQWSGPVSTVTPAGSFDRWFVDFRPVSAGQVSQYSTPDASTANYLSFFIVKHDNRLKVAMRTEGVFQNKGCVTYEVMDSVNEGRGYYRFSDFNVGDKRAYTEFTFKDDEFIMEVYTNKFNRLSSVELHARWQARLGSREAADAAIKHFNFPQPVAVKDFSDVFRNMPETIYYTFENDPYSSRTQPYVGNITVNISIDSSIRTQNNHKLFLLLTTQSLFDGLRYIPDNLKYISKYSYLPVNARTHTFTNVHPGRYYLYSYIDTNNDQKYLTGDFMSSDLNNTIVLAERGNVTANTIVNFAVP